MSTYIQQGTSNPNVQHGTSYTNIVSQPNMSDSQNQNQQSSELTELKSMLKMLMQQMNNMFSVLTTVFSKIKLWLRKLKFQYGMPCRPILMQT